MPPRGHVQHGAQGTESASVKSIGEGGIEGMGHLQRYQPKAFETTEARNPSGDGRAEGSMSLRKSQ